MRDLLPILCDSHLQIPMRLWACPRSIQILLSLIVKIVVETTELVGAENSSTRKLTV